MKNKILDALKEGHKNLGLSDSALERAATFGATFITSEEQIAGFVSAVEPMLKAEQSAADKVRTELSTKIRGLEGEKADLEAKLKDGNKPDPDKKDPPKDEPQGEMAQLIKLMQEQNEQMRKQNEALTARFDAFEAERNAKSAFSTAEATFKDNDYVKKYADEATDAWERATEIYEATGKKWTAEKLNEKAMGYFNKAVAKKGVDTSKPFDGDGGSGKEVKTDFSDHVAMLKSQGIELPE